MGCFLLCLFLKLFHWPTPITKIWNTSMKCSWHWTRKQRNLRIKYYIIYTAVLSCFSLTWLSWHLLCFYILQYKRVLTKIAFVTVLILFVAGIFDFLITVLGIHFAFAIKRELNHRQQKIFTFLIVSISYCYCHNITVETLKNIVRFKIFKQLWRKVSKYLLIAGHHF